MILRCVAHFSIAQQETEKSNKDQFKLSPNPGNGRFIITLPQHFTKNKTIIITNPAGNEIMRIAGDAKTSVYRGIKQCGKRHLHCNCFI